MIVNIELKLRHCLTHFYFKKCWGFIAQLRYRASRHWLPEKIVKILSGEREGHCVGLSLPIHLSGKISLLKLWQLLWPVAAGPIAQLRNEPPTFFKIKCVKQCLNCNPIFIIFVNSQLCFTRIDGMRISCFLYIYIWMQRAWNYSNGAKSWIEHPDMSLMASTLLRGERN